MLIKILAWMEMMVFLKKEIYKNTLLITVILCSFFVLSYALYGCVEEAVKNGNIFDRAGEEEVSEEKDKKIDPEEEARRQEEERLAEEVRLLEERRLREEELKEKLGPFFVPLPPLEQKENPPVLARGIYLTGHTAGHRERLPALIQLVEETELNAMVIDVKDDHGRMTYPSSIEIVKQVGADERAPVSDMKALLDDLHSRGIYTIARIVVFKDPFLAEKRQDWGIQRKGGGLWRDRKGVAWINPYDKNVWDYNIAIAKEATLLGFREIQFDYVRFPENARRVDEEAFYPGQNGLEKDAAIENFLIYAREELAEYNVHLAADVFGVIATSWGDSDQIGQTWEKIAPHVDYQCPMIYPSHYGQGYFGLAVPDAQPQVTIRRALEDAIKRNAPLKEPAIIRPWLQSFTASWVKGHIPYGAKEVRQQIDTALELGIEEYLIWNPGNRYQRDSFLTAEEAEERAAGMRKVRREKGVDVLGRTAEDALAIYLEACRNRDWREASPLQATGNSMGHDQFWEMMDSGTGKPGSLQVIEIEERADGVCISFDLIVRASTGETKELLGEAWTIIKENHIWKVKPSAAFLEAMRFS